MLILVTIAKVQQDVALPVRACVRRRAANQHGQPGKRYYRVIRSHLRPGYRGEAPAPRSRMLGAQPKHTTPSLSLRKTCVLLHFGVSYSGDGKKLSRCYSPIVAMLRPSSPGSQVYLLSFVTENRGVDLLHVCSDNLAQKI